MLSKTKNEKLNPYNIYFVDTAINLIGATQIKIDSMDEFNLFSGKILKIVTDTGEKLIGKLIVKNDNSQYELELLNPLNGNEFETRGTYYETFSTSIEDDNSHVTFSDIKKHLIATEDVYDSVDSLNYLGEDGLLSSHDKLKLNQNKIEFFPTGKTISMLTVTPTLLGIININNNESQKYTNFSHIFGISGKAFNLLCQITLKNTSNDVDSFELKIINFSTIEKYKNIGIEILMTRKKASNKDILIINAKFNISKISTQITIGTDPHIINNILHYVDKITDIRYSEPLLVSPVILPLRFNKNNIGTPVYDTTFLIENSTLSYTINGQKIILPKELLPTVIPTNANLNNYTQPGKFYLHNGNITSILNKPIANNLRFNLEVINLNYENTANENMLLQIYTCYQQIGITNNYQIITFERVSTYIASIFTWSPWIETCKKIHTHSANDILETTTKKFVTETDINNWNALLSTSGTSSSWKAAVSNPNQLTTIYPSPQNGWCCFVLSTNSIWSFNGSSWENQNSFATETTDGKITKELFIEHFVGASLSKKIDFTDSFINRLTENPESIYGVNYVNVSNNHIDYVKRTNPIAQQLKEFTIQEGWNVNGYGTKSYLKGLNINSVYDNSIGIGEGLEYSLNNQTIFGKFNLLSTDLFVIGNGNSTTNRSNLFSINQTGITKANGYSTPTGTANDLLLANGNTQSKSALIQTIFNDLAIAGKETINITTNVEEFIVNWNSTRKTNFGLFGNFEVWMEVGTNVYEKQEVPIRLITETNLDNNLQAVSYTFTLSGLNAMIIIK